MNKGLKALLMSVGCIILLFVCFMAYALYKMDEENSTLRPVETVLAVPNVFAIKDSYANMYLYKVGDKYIAFDAAVDIEVVSSEFKKLNINPSDVVALFLTHSDRDHVGGLTLFENATIFLPRAEEQMINGETYRKFFFANSFESDYTLLSDGGVITISGVRVESFLVPGHTPGSTSYLVNKKHLFVGDSLSLIDGKVELFNDFYNMDSELQAVSLKDIANLDAEYIFTAHYGFSNDYRGAFAKWRD